MIIWESVPELRLHFGQGLHAVCVVPLVLVVRLHIQELNKGCIAQ